MATRREVAAWWFQNRMKKAGAGYSDEAQSVIDSFPNALTDGEADLIASFVDSLNDRGDWLTRDSFIHLGMQDAANALWDWRRLSASTAVNAPTHTPGTGYVFNGTTQYIDTNHNLAVDSTHYTLNDAHIGAFCVDNNDVLQSAISLCGSASGSNTSRVLWINNPKLNARINSSLTSPDYNGEPNFQNNTLYILTRSSSSDVEYYKNGVTLGTPSGVLVSDTIPNNDVFIGADNRSGTPFGFFDGTISSFIAGSEIGFDHANYYADLVTLNTGLAAI